MQEDFLHFIWRYQKFNWNTLHATTGETITLIYPGEPNIHGGPDFLNARIQLGSTLWAGNIEIHIRASEWNVHRHDTDPAYDNVILHVVLEEDTPIYRSNGERLLCLELRHRILPGMRKSYYNLLNDQNHWIPCQPQLHEADHLTRKLWLERLSIERLEQRVERLQDILRNNNQDWEETFYQAFSRNLGQPANADPFEALSRITPLSLLRKKRHDLFQLEALLFGQAGLLEIDFLDTYPKSLQQEYQFLRHQFGLQPIQSGAWKFLRMRPANFPTLRIAQMARLVYQTDHLFDKVMSALNLDELYHLFDLKISQYWRTHYRFDHPSPSKTKALGQTTIHQLLLNTIVPFLFFYGATQQSKRHQHRALDILTQLPPENNQIIRRWQTLGFNPENAAQSQALIQLKKQYCDTRRCLHCGLGHAILKKAGFNI